MTDEEMAEEYVKEKNRKLALNGGRGSGRTLRLLYEIFSNIIEKLKKENTELKEKNVKYKEMCEDMKADMCETDNEVLCDYLSRLLRKYGEIV